MKSAPVTDRADRAMPRHLLAVLAYAGRREARPGRVDGTADLPEALLDRLAAAARMQ
jgi:hypothetical protein